MKRKGASYVVGRVMGFNWRPILIQRLWIDCGRSIDRLMVAAEDAMQKGLKVWLSPGLWDKSPRKTLKYITKAAIAAEKLRHRYPERLVFSVGSALTLFMQGIVEDSNVVARIKNRAFMPRVKAGRAQQAT